MHGIISSPLLFPDWFKIEVGFLPGKQPLKNLIFLICKVLSTGQFRQTFTQAHFLEAVVPGLSCNSVFG